MEEECAVEVFFGEQDIYWKVMECWFYGWVVRVLSFCYVALFYGFVKFDSEVEKGVHWMLVGLGQLLLAYLTKVMFFDGGVGWLL